jgi:hypothetical protein
MYKNGTRMWSMYVNHRLAGTRGGPAGDSRNWSLELETAEKRSEVGVKPPESPSAPKNAISRSPDLCSIL